jgi:hypothetical protein
MTFTNKTKNASTFSEKTKSGTLGYILTPDSFHILVGENEDLLLAWSVPISWTHLTKN